VVCFLLHCLLFFLTIFCKNSKSVAWAVTLRVYNYVNSPMYADDLILLLMLVTHMRQMTLKKLRSQHPVIKYGIERQSGEDLSTKFNKMSKYKILLDLIISVVPLPLLFLKVLSKQV